MNTEKTEYVSPQMEVIEIAVEQAILQASGGDYPLWEPEEEL